CYRDWSSDVCSSDLYVAELCDRPLELPGDLCRLGQGTVFQQDTEFIAAEACERVPAAQATAQQAADLAEQVIPGFVTARVVHELESVQVQIAQNVFRYAGRGLRQHARQALRELFPADQPRPSTRRTFVREFASGAPPLRH